MSSYSSLLSRAFIKACIIFSSLTATVASSESVDVYFGTAGNNSAGIYHSTFNTHSGTLSTALQAHDIAAPRFLTISPNKQYLYTVAAKNTPKEYIVAAYKIESDGNLTYLNDTPLSGKSGTHINAHPSGEFLLTAQYASGSVAVFPLTKNGHLNPVKQLIKHKGHSNAVPTRQEAPHPHWVGFSPDGNYAFAPDLGKDQIVIYRVDKNTNTLIPHGHAQSVRGGGPRHMRFSTDGKFIYLLNELALSVTTFAYDSKTGTTKKLTTTQALNEATQAKEMFNSASEILVHPSGNFVYSGNRGNDSITAYKANQKTGKLDVIEVEAIRGSWPRSIQLDPTGQWLLAAGARSNTISVFSIDQETGELTFKTDSIINVPEPISIAFAAPRNESSEMEDATRE